MDQPEQDKQGGPTPVERAANCRTWARQLLASWRMYNEDYANRRMRVPVMLVAPLTRTLGSWCSESRVLRIAYEHIERDPWHVVLGTLRHEMAHQYVDEVLGARDEVAHGAAFQRACHILRADPSATSGVGVPSDAARQANDEAQRLTRRVAKLLALGGSPNEHEAASAVQKARALMLEHNVDLVGSDRARGFEMLVLGGVSKRRPAWESSLAGLLPEYFFVEVITSPGYDATSDTTGNAYYVYGTPSNLAMAEYVYAYISGLLPGLWEEHKRVHSLQGNRARLEFYEGVVHGFRKKLEDEERARASSEHALIWRGDPRLIEFYRWHNPRVRTTYGAARARGEAYGAGREAGGRVTLRKPLASESGGFGGFIEG